MLLSLEEDQPPENQFALADLMTMTLGCYLDRRLAADASGHVLIFDQFEEIMAVEPTDRAGKTAFFAQLGAALRDRGRWALFALREDYLAALEVYLRPIPTRLSNTFRLDLLGAEAARLAIQQPALQAGVRFGDVAVARLVDDLRRIRAQGPDGATEERLGPYIEPVQLQVVCRRLWERLFAAENLEGRRPGDRETGRPGDQADKMADQMLDLPSSAPSAPSATELCGDITEDDVEEVGDVDSVLADYYAERVMATAAACDVGERTIRDWFEHRLISDQGIRSQVLWGASRSAGLADRAIRHLIENHLVRAEKRRGGVWFELVHDSLIEPIRRDNARWREANLGLLQRQAALWERHSRADGFLLRGAALAEAEQWAAAHRRDLLDGENEFLAACRAEQRRVAREQRMYRLVRRLAMGSTALSCISIAAFCWALAERNRARAERDRARRQIEQALTARLAPHHHEPVA